MTTHDRMHQMKNDRHLHELDSQVQLKSLMVLSCENVPTLPLECGRYILKRQFHGLYFKLLEGLFNENSNILHHPSLLGSFGTKQGNQGRDLNGPRAKLHDIG
jgi:hypothetical protein